MSLTNPSSSNTTLNRSALMDDESIYVLPKTYNGKTVTELFPEFQYDSVISRASSSFASTSSSPCPFA